MKSNIFSKRNFWIFCYFELWIIELFKNRFYCNSKDFFVKNKVKKIFEKLWEWKKIMHLETIHETNAEQ